ncbi:UPF0102 protein [Insulibacter thermoxylanivorax]|uniref:UPF0102 protein PRECH8_10450 n=1 Tax=Insulibacter thermoxylanivorax TaxID=2749268 RepID=A0A916QF13_9BACL|nr:YraN family protein [Insulibacter thermoxylanivorax]GFR37749.1 UPF0102 protein [Insulibacter thermoxylanivorax]
MTYGDYRRRLGQKGEQAACSYLLSRGYRLIDRNWRCRLGEIDVVAGLDEQLVIVEVRTRSSDRFGSAAESIDARKQCKLRQLALLYMKEKHYPQDTRLRFDVIAVRMLADGGVQIEHIPEAF